MKLSPKDKPGSVRQVTAFLRDNGVKDVRLERQVFYFDFAGFPTEAWLSRRTS